MSGPLDHPYEPGVSRVANPRPRRLKTTVPWDEGTWNAAVEAFVTTIWELPRPQRERLKQRFISEFVARVYAAREGRR